MKAYIRLNFLIRHFHFVMISHFPGGNHFPWGGRPSIAQMFVASPPPKQRTNPNVRVPTGYGSSCANICGSTKLKFWSYLQAPSLLTSTLRGCRTGGHGATKFERCLE